MWIFFCARMWYLLSVDKQHPPPSKHTHTVNPNTQSWNFHKIQGRFMCCEMQPNKPNIKSEVQILPLTVTGAESRKIQPLRPSLTYYNTHMANSGQQGALNTSWFTCVLIGILETSDNIKASQSTQEQSLNTLLENLHSMFKINPFTFLPQHI